MRGDDLEAAFFLTPLSGSDVPLEVVVVFVGLGGGVLELELDVAEMSPAPPLPAAVRGTTTGWSVGPAAF